MSDGRDAQADEDFARNRIRGIRHAIERFEEQRDTYGKPGYPWEELIARIKKDCDAVLSRPRANGAIIDGLERTIGDLRSQIIDIDVHKMERDEALKRARAAESEIQIVRLTSGRLERLGSRLDQIWGKVIGRCS